MRRIEDHLHLCVITVFYILMNVCHNECCSKNSPASNAGNEVSSVLSIAPCYMLCVKCTYSRGIILRFILCVIVLTVVNLTDGFI